MTEFDAESLVCLRSRKYVRYVVDIVCISYIEVIAYY